MRIELTTYALRVRSNRTRTNCFFKDPSGGGAFPHKSVMPEGYMFDETPDSAK